MELRRKKERGGGKIVHNSHDVFLRSPERKRGVVALTVQNGEVC